MRWKWLEMIAKREASKTVRQEDSAVRDHPTVRCECGFGREEAGMVRSIAMIFRNPPLLIQSNRYNATAATRGSIVTAMDLC